MDSVNSPTKKDSRDWTYPHLRIADFEETWLRPLSTFINMTAAYCHPRSLHDADPAELIITRSIPSNPEMANEEFTKTRSTAEAWTPGTNCQRKLSAHRQWIPLRTGWTDTGRIYHWCSTTMRRQVRTKKIQPKNDARACVEDCRILCIEIH